MQPVIAGTRRPSTWWWFLVPLLSVGFFTFAMLLGAGLMLRHRMTQIFAGVYFVVAVAGCVVASFASQGSAAADSVGPAILMLLWLVGTGHVLALQIWVSNRSADGPVPAPVQIPDPAVAAAQWRLSRRQEARNIVATNPVLANELRIGRPELPNRTYDDGGLVDVNHVPAEWLAAQLEMPPEMAQQIVEARTRLGGFSQPEDLVVYCDAMTPQRLSVIRDRLCFMPM